MSRLFGTDGIRGRANLPPMDPETSLLAGRALVETLKKTNRRPLIIIGKDTRVSGPMIEGALISGITSAGGDACPVGILPTPAVAYITKEMKADAGIMISASHNPFYDNGIKIFSSRGIKLTDSQEEEMEGLIMEDPSDLLPADSDEIGVSREVEMATDAYVHFAKSTFPASLSLEGVRVVLDTANGATSCLAPEIFLQLGADVAVIHNEPDGFNINDQCGSQHTEDLRREVLEQRATLGFAFDGDGDRLIAVDEKGEELSGDQCMFICAMDMKSRGLLKKGLLVGTVMSNIGLKTACEKEGISFHASRVGDRYVLEDMLRLGAAIGGEQSGHMIFLDHHTTGDGIISALQIAGAVVSDGRPLSSLKSVMRVFPQKLINVEVTEKPDMNDIPDIMDIIVEVEKELADRGRVLVRYSGTQPMCRVMVEGPEEELTERLCARIAERVKSVLG